MSRGSGSGSEELSSRSLPLLTSPLSPSLSLSSPHLPPLSFSLFLLFLCLPFSLSEAETSGDGETKGRVNMGESSLPRADWQFKPMCVCGSWCVDVGGVCVCILCVGGV